MKRKLPKKNIQKIVKRIVKDFQPERIILFGSHARSEGGPDSDVDLLVVMPVEGSRLDKAIEIGVALHDIRVPKDIIVTTPEDFEWRKDIAGTIERPAVLEGEILYAKWWWVEDQRRLTAYATVTRYPGDYETIPLVETRKAVAIARRIRREVRSFMPKKAIRKRKK